MRPVVLGGPPHTRATSINGGGPVSTENGAWPGVGIGTDSLKGANRVFPHLDDLVSVRPDVNTGMSMRKILQDGELLAKQADTHLDFRRPDVALQEYIKASIIAVEIIPRHKDYPSVQYERGEMHRLFAGLIKRINSQNEKFGQVKEQIKENNARSGVEPKSARTSMQNSTGPANSQNQANGHVRSQSAQLSSANDQTSYGVSHFENGIAPLSDRITHSDGIIPRKKPVVQPKPESLHGNVIASNGNSSQTDLAARLARLRTPDSKSRIQDPRIKTQPIHIPNAPEPRVMPPDGMGALYTTIRPVGPREMPEVPRTVPHPDKITIDAQIPQMPRAPDAIYSPARNADNIAIANLPSSIAKLTAYIGSGRTNTAPPISTVGPTPAPTELRDDYFAPTHAVNTHTAPILKKRTDIFIPNSVYISAQDLYDYIQKGSHVIQILIVDIRSRGQYDSGHIMWQSIVCIEPITLRRGMSGDELTDSMVMAPDFEQGIFNRREDFDLVVFYDQSSTIVNPFSSSTGDSSNALHNFTQTVYDYGYEKRLQRRPMLLVGGLDAWVDLLGFNSLKMSNTSITTADAVNKKGPKGVKSLGHFTPSRIRPSTTAGRKKIESRPLTNEEESQWDETLRADQIVGRPADADDSISDEQFYVKTTDDFFRRFPDVTTMQESMMSMAPPPRPLASYDGELASNVPRPPTRPPPALPRQRSSGISERGPTAAYAPAHAVNGTASITPQVKPPGLTGLANPGNLCYLNSSTQALSSTAFIRDILLCIRNNPGSFPRVPRKSGEKTDPPQLMSRQLANVLSHLWSGNYEWIAPRTLQAYVNAVHVGKGRGLDASRAFGGDLQHDAAEYLTFIIGLLDDEMNPRRNEPAIIRNLNPTQEKIQNSRPVMTVAREAWNDMLVSEFSPITRKMKGQTVAISRCRDCKHESRAFDTFTAVDVAVSSDQRRINLSTKLREYCGVNSSESLDDYTCDGCKRKSTTTSTRYFTYLPEYLQINLKKFAHDGNQSTKIAIDVNFTERNNDLAPYFHSGSIDKDDVDRGRTGPFLYECYATIHHVGRTLNSGHYWTIAKSLDKGGKGAGSWHKYNDRYVESAAFTSTQHESAYIVFLRRQR